MIFALDFPDKQISHGGALYFCLPAMAYRTIFHLFFLSQTAVHNHRHPDMTPVPPH